jgi:hypothetical protein
MGSLRMHTCAVLGDFSFYKRLFASAIAKLAINIYKLYI